MDQEEVGRGLAASMTRRSVVKTGVKLAYAAPLVAASFKLTADGALAAVCPPKYTRVTVTGGETCCKCRSSVLIRRTLVVVNGSAVCQAPKQKDVAAECTGLVQSVPR